MRTRLVVTSTTLILLLAIWASAIAPARAARLAQSAKAAAPAKPTPEALDKLLGPIALYPDQLLSQVLMCAAEPGKVATLGEWLASNQALKGSALQEAAMKAGFDASFVAIVVFPQVVDMMVGDAAW